MYGARDDNPISTPVCHLPGKGISFYRIQDSNRDRLDLMIHQGYHFINRSDLFYVDAFSLNRFFEADLLIDKDRPAQISGGHAVLSI